MKVRDLIREIEAHGWYLHSQQGSHRHFKHPEKTGKVTVAYDPGDEIPEWYANKIRRQAGIR